MRALAAVTHAGLDPAKINHRATVGSQQGLTLYTRGERSLYSQGRLILSTKNLFHDHVTLKKRFLERVGLR